VVSDYKQSNRTERTVTEQPMGDTGMTARQGQIKELRGNTCERYFQQTALQTVPDVIH
jgi:hypothetical protein